MREQGRHEIEILEHIAVLRTNRVMTLELNLISYNGSQPQYDLRYWYTRNGKRHLSTGIMLTKDELHSLVSAATEAGDLSQYGTGKTQTLDQFLQGTEPTHQVLKHLATIRGTEQAALMLSVVSNNDTAPVYELGYYLLADTNKLLRSGLCLNQQAMQALVAAVTKEE